MLERERRCSSSPFLLVEDNGDRGGAGVTFTGRYYRRQKFARRA
jgi:hypothetical protein